MTTQAWDSVLRQVDDELLERALRAGRGVSPQEGPSVHSGRRRTTRHFSRALLIAAVVAALLAVTALAAAVWGLRERSIPAETTVTAFDDGTYEAAPVSLAGIEGSPEYEASAEWIRWHSQYEAAQPAGWIDDDWEPADPALRGIWRFYPCYDDAMLQKLLEISEKHGLKLHTLRVAPISMEDFYAKAGTEAFTRGENQPVGGYIYEDGSFRLDGDSTLCADGMYTLLRNMTGTLPAVESFVWDQGGYTESVCRTALGAQVVIARHAQLPQTFIFYSDGRAFLQLSARVADETAAKALADTFDFAAACAGEPRVLEMANAAPKAVEADGAVTLEDFAESPEYKGLREFTDTIRARGVGNYSDVFPVPELYADLQWLNGTAEELCGKYGLTAHTDKREIYDYAQACQAAGADDFVLDPTDGYGGFSAMKLYEDGSFTMNHGFFYYIRKGSLCTDSQIAANWLDLSSYTQSWQYETASGAVVCCATGPGQASMVLYETPLAWAAVLGGDDSMPAGDLEAIAERCDFTRLP